MLGRGAMGVVFLAHDNLLDRDVAIKKQSLDSSHDLDDDQVQAAIARFSQEAKAAARLNHPNIVTIYQVGRSENQNYIVMELLQGKTMDEWLKGGHVFSPSQVANIAIQICRALNYAHNSGIIHRDIKPQNIFISDDFTVKLNDFGVARMSVGAEVKTIAGTFVGTPSYSSPEQWHGSDFVDGRTDLYSTGIVMYRLLTGTLPFSSNNFQDLRLQIFSVDPTPVHAITATVPEELSKIVMKAIRKEPEKRFQSGDEMADAIVAALEMADNDASGKTTKIINSFDQEFSQLGKATQSLSDKQDAPLVVDRVNFDNSEWIFSIFKTWEKKELKGGSVQTILDQILNVPIYTDPFSGILLINREYLILIWKGMIIEAITHKDSLNGNDAMGSIPSQVDSFTLCKPPNDERAGLILLLATIISEDKALHLGLDSAIIDFPGLIKKYVEERFTGIVRLCYLKGEILIGFFNGATAIVVESVEAPKTSAQVLLQNISLMVKGEPCKVDVFESNPQPLRESMRRMFADLKVTVNQLDKTVNNYSSLLGDKTEDIHPRTVEDLLESVQLELAPEKLVEVEVGNRTIKTADIVKGDSTYRLINWIMFDLFLDIISSGNRDSMKYIYTWIPEIKTIRFNHSLRGDDGKLHLFDIVTFDKKGKILHLVWIGKNGAEDQVSQFLDKVVSVKHFYKKSGDIGGVFYVTPSNFSEKAISFYHEQTTQKKKNFNLGYLDSLTGYKGFFRIGKDRGFHFCLIQQTETGFRLVGPVL